MEYPVKEEMEDFYLFSPTQHAINADYINPQELRVMQITTPGRDAYPSSLLADREKDYPDNLSTWSGTHGMFRMRSTSGETEKTIGLSQ